MAWLVESNALTPEVAGVLEKIHEHRNEIAHELPKILIDSDFEVDASLLIDQRECGRARVRVKPVAEGLQWLGPGSAAR